MKRFSGDVTDDKGTRLTNFAFLFRPPQHTEHNDFADRAPSFVKFLVSVLVLFLAANIGLIGLHCSRELLDECLESSRLHGKADTMKHMPCRWLSDADSAGNFARGYAVFGIGDKPDTREPLVKTEGAVLKDSADFD